MNSDDRIVRIFKTLDQDALIELAVIFVAAGLLIHLLQRLLPWIASRLHGRKRLHLLASVPFVRLLLIVTALTLIVPRLIEPSMQNMVALLGTVGLALGFVGDIAFKADGLTTAVHYALGHSLGTVFIQVGDHNRSTGAGKGFGYAASDTVRCAGDNGDTASLLAGLLESPGHWFVLMFWGVGSGCSAALSCTDIKS